MEGAGTMALPTGLILRAISFAERPAYTCFSAAMIFSLLCFVLFVLKSSSRSELFK
jgi:type IV secretory pathway TrbL component